MRCGPRALFICCVVICGMPQSSDAFAEERTTPPDLKTAVRITGRVINESDGEPVRGAAVFVLWPAEDGRRSLIKEIKSDENGDFSQETSRPGRFLVWANHGNRTSRTKWREADTVIVTIDGRHPEPIDLRLRQATTIRAHVTDKNGGAVREAVVHLQWSDLPDFKTDASGVASVEPLPPQRWFIEVWAVGYAKQAIWLNAESGHDVDLALTLLPGAVVEGTVRDPDGKPLAGAQVGADVVADHELRWFYQPADGEGRYRIANFPLNKELLLRVEKNGYLREELELSLSETTTHRDITLRPRPHGGSIQGTVADGHGRPISGALLMNQGNHSADACMARSGADGRFAIDDLFESFAGYQVAVRAKGFAPKVVAVKPGPANAPRQVDIVLEAGHRIKGRVVDEQGRPLGEVLVAWGEPIRNTGASTSTDAAGRFELDSLPADCALEFIKEGYSSLSDQRLPLDGEGLVTVVLSPQGVIRGKVIDARSGEPVPTFNVRITFSPQQLPSDRQDTLRSDLIEPGQTFKSSDGLFELNELVLRMPLQVMVDAEGYERCIHERIECRAPNDAQPVEFRMTAEDPAQLVAYRGRVVDAKGAPIAGAQVRLIAATRRDARDRNRFPFNWTMIETRQLAQQNGVRRFLEAATGKDGAFHFERIPREVDTELVWWGKGVTPGRRAGLEKLDEPERETIDIRLTAPARITGGIDRTAFPEASRVILHPAVRGVMDSMNVTLKSDQETFEFADLPNGKYTLTLMGPLRSALRGTGMTSQPLDAVQVELMAGEQKEIVFPRTGKRESQAPLND